MKKKEKKERKRTCKIIESKRNENCISDIDIITKRILFIGLRA